jgi:hypothetical protein
MLQPNSSFLLKTGATEGTQTFQRFPLSADVIGTDANGNVVDASSKLQQEHTYETIPDLVHESSYVSGSYVTTDNIIGLHAGFEISDSWLDGELKQFQFRGICRPIKINGSNQFDSTTFNKVTGKIIISVENNNSLFYIGSNSYIDNHVVSDESYISKEIRSYTLLFEIKRSGSDLVVTSIKYTIPYFKEDSDNGIYAQGEFTFRSMCGSDPGSTGDNKNLGMFLLNGGTAFTDNDISKITITIGTDWMPLSEIGSCDNWISLFNPDTEGHKMYLTIKPFKISTVV